MQWNLKIQFSTQICLFWQNSFRSETFETNASWASDPQMYYKKIMIIKYFNHKILKINIFRRGPEPLRANINCVFDYEILLRITGGQFQILNT